MKESIIVKLSELLPDSANRTFVISIIIFAVVALSIGIPVINALDLSSALERTSATHSNEFNIMLELNGTLSQSLRKANAEVTNLNILLDAQEEKISELLLEIDILEQQCVAN